MFIGAYWQQREESKDGVAERIAAFFQVLASCDERFVTWYSSQKSRSVGLNSTIGLDVSSIVKKLSPNRLDVNRNPIPELGYSLGAWNGKDASFSATIGSWSPYVRNSVVLNLGEDDQYQMSVLKDIIEEMIHVFDPDYAVATSHEHLSRVGATMPWESGIYVYKKGGRVEQLF